MISKPAAATVESAHVPLNNGHPTVHPIRLGFLVAALCCLSFAVSARPKTDIIEFANGDRLTGEIRGLSRGMLQVKTDNMGTVNIEWPSVVRISSDIHFQVENIQGERIFGAVMPSVEPRVLQVAFGRGSQSEAFSNIVRITPVEDTLGDRIKGGLSLGLNYSEASAVSQLNFAGDITYTAEIYRLTGSASLYVTEVSEGTSTRRSDISAAYQRLRDNRWFNWGSLGWQQNEELGLKSRVLLGGGIGRDIFFSSQQTLSLTAGPLLSVEEFFDESGQTTSGELGLMGTYSKFKFNDSELDLKVDLGLFPSLTESGRWRAELNSRLRYKLTDDLTWDLTFYGSRDSREQADGGANSDVGVTNSLGYSF